MRVLWYVSFLQSNIALLRNKVNKNSFHSAYSSAYLA